MLTRVEEFGCLKVLQLHMTAVIALGGSLKQLGPLTVRVQSWTVYQRGLAPQL